MKLIYTPEQQTAIQHRNGNLLILACAGSGKTEVISRRIAELVRENISKSEIIAFTFTERAAKELKARIRLHLENLNPSDPSLGDMYIGTIHSFCLQLLKEIDPKYRVYEVMDEARQAALIMTNYYYFEDSNKGIGLDRLRHRTRTGGYWDTVRNFVTTLNIIHQQRITTDRITDSELRQIVKRYRKVAHGHPNFFLDFDQIISELIKNLKSNPKKLHELRKRFKYLVVDEYQDVDDRQEELIRLLSDNGKKIWVTVVGDDDQAIYGWRGARIQNILNFKRKYPKVEEIKIVYNFRSTHAIVEIAKASIRALPPGSRIVKDMLAMHWDEKNSPPTLAETMTERGDIQKRTFDSDEAEANWIADRIEQLHGVLIKEKNSKDRAIDYADIALLLRSVRSSGRIFANVLRDRGIPTVVKGIGGLFDNEEVLLIQAAFCLLARADLIITGNDGQKQRLDEPAIRNLIRLTIDRLSSNNSMPYAKAATFLEWIAAKREKLDKQNLEKESREGLSRRIYPQDLFHEMLSELGSTKDFKPWPQAVLFNLGRLSGLITQFEAVHQWVNPRDLGVLCMFLGGWAAGQVDEGGLDESGTPNAVQIMTVHAAKGLEWPVVFIPRVSSMNFPSSMRNRGPETFLSKSLFNPKDYAAGDDGERRLWYVALTRCQKFLNITSQDRYRKKPTPYFTGVKHERVQKMDPTADRPKGTPTPPANVELLPSTYSDLNYFWRCPFEYQLRALMGFGPGVSESYGYGQQLHNILAEIHTHAVSGRFLSSDDLDELVKTRFHLRYTRDGIDYKPFSKLRDAAKLALKRYHEKFPDNAQYVLEAEKPFEFLDRKSGALISGTIDLLEKIEKTPTGEVKQTPVGIVDFKTHRWKDASTFEKKKSEVETQLCLYAIAVQKALGFKAHKARAHFLSPKPPPPVLLEQGVKEVIDVNISHQKQSELRSRVRHAVKGIQDSIEKKAFALKGCKNGYCETCDFRTFCPGYNSWKKNNPSKPRPLSIANSRREEMRLLSEDVDAG